MIIITNNYIYKYNTTEFGWEDNFARATNCQLFTVYDKKANNLFVFYFFLSNPSLESTFLP